MFLCLFLLGYTRLSHPVINVHNWAILIDKKKLEGPRYYFNLELTLDCIDKIFRKIFFVENMDILKNTNTLKNCF